MRRRNCIPDERMELFKFHRGSQILGAHAPRFEFTDGVGFDVVDDDGRGVVTERLCVRHEMQAVVGTQAQPRNQQVDVAAAEHDLAGGFKGRSLQQFVPEFTQVRELRHQALIATVHSKDLHKIPQ